MTANQSTPSNEGKGSVASLDYQNVGQTLLQSELERHGFAIRESFLKASDRVARGDSLDERDVRDLREDLEQAKMLVDVIEESME